MSLIKLFLIREIYATLWNAIYSMKAMSVKKNACRSLGFPAYDVEMADGDQEVSRLCTCY